MKQIEEKLIGVEKMVDQVFGALEILKQYSCMELAMFPSKYNENFVREFYANLDVGIEDPKSPHYEVVYVQGTIVAFSPSNNCAFPNLSPS